MEQPTKSCGTCTLCCKLMGVPELDKDRGVWCVHADPTKGNCKIYETRPQSCRLYNCLWLTEAGLGPEFRPDRTRTVLMGYIGREGGKPIIAICDRATPMAWKQKPIIGLLKTAAAHKHPVYAVAGQRTWQIFPDREVEADNIPLPAGIDMGE